MPEKNNGIVEFRSYKDLRNVLASNYQKQIENFFGDDKQALKFLSGVVAEVQRNPKLLQCTPHSVINSFITMAQLRLMPSGVSGEAYVIPYNNKKKDGNRYVEVMEAQFQLGYQGLVTLFYRAGAKSVVAEIVRAKDTFSYVNGMINHSPDYFLDDRGEAIGAYVIIELGTGGIVNKVMKKADIVKIGARFSKTYSTEYSPWKEKNDPELWMWKKTVLKQIAKLVPKNEEIMRAIYEDNKESVISTERLERSNEEAKTLTMGSLLVDHDKDQEEDISEDEEDTIQFEDESPDSDEDQGK